MVVGTSTHTQRLECSLTSYPLSVCVCVCVFGCGGGVPTSIPRASRCGGVVRPAYEDAKPHVTHIHLRHTNEIYVFEPVFLQLVWLNVVVSMLVFDAFLMQF